MFYLIKRRKPVIGLPLLQNEVTKRNLAPLGVKLS